MAVAERKDAALARIDAERDAWEHLAARGDAAKAEEPALPGGWSFKDLAAHITAWRTTGLARMEAGARGEPVPPDPWPADLATDDEINAWFMARDKGRPTADVLAEASASFDRLRAVIAAIPAETLFDAEGHPYADGRSLGDLIASGDYFDHLHDEHARHIAAWLALTEPVPAQ